MNRKGKGTRNEHRSIEILEKAGYRCTRSAASGGDWDIVGIGPKDFVCCQVKTRDFPGVAEMENLKNFPCPFNCKKLIHRWKDRQRLPDVKEVKNIREESEDENRGN